MEKVKKLVKITQISINKNTDGKTHPYLNTPHYTMRSVRNRPVSESAISSPR